VSTAPDIQVSPAAASDGANYFLVWTDRRAGQAAGNDLYGARINAAGQVLDPDGAPLVTAAGNQSAPAIPREGTGYLPSWTDTGAIRGARMSSDGMLLDPSGFAVTATVGRGRPRVASGASSLIVWFFRESPSVSNIYAGRVASGSVLDPSGIPISTAVHDDF